MRTDADLTQAMQLHSDTVWRICTLHLPQKADAEDTFQNVFLKYALYESVFKDEEHRKSWFIRVTLNSCIDLLRSHANRNIPLDTVLYNESFSTSPPEITNPVFEALQSLPENYRTVLYLGYYEGYTSVEISMILDKPVNTIYTWMARGKETLKEVLERENNRVGNIRSVQEGTRI